MENKMSTCPTCGQEVKPSVRLATRVRRVNDALFSAGKTYFDTQMEAHKAVTASLSANEFNTQPYIDAPELPRGDDKFFNAPVGDGKYVSATLHRMPSGRYELVAYVS